MFPRHGRYFSGKKNRTKQKIEDGSYRKIKMIDQTKEVDLAVSKERCCSNN
jgi:hypothetical protein